MARILLVDDDSKIRTMVRVVLERFGFEVMEAIDGEAALRIARAEKADLVVSDVFMPDCDGLELLRNLRRELPDLKVISMSGGTLGGKIDLLTVARYLGATETIHKPFTATALLALVNRALGIAPSETEADGAG